MFKWVVRFVVLGLVAAVVLLAIEPRFRGLVSMAGYEEAALDPETLGLLDVGVTDVDRDGLPDVFTSNRYFRQSVHLSRPDGGLERRVLSDLLPHDPDYPGLEPGEGSREPRAGLGLWFAGEHLRLAFEPSSDASGARGSLHSPAALEVDADDGFALTPEGMGTLAFAASGSARARVRPAYAAVPYTLELGSSAVPVSLGDVEPAAGDSLISFSLQHRHGHAWTDVDADGTSDVFIVRGTPPLESTRLEDGFFDELFFGEPEGPWRQTAFPDEDGSCSAFKAVWVDVDADGRLDLYQSCHLGEPNRLYLQDSDGGFRRGPADSGVALTGNGFEGHFLWVDVDRDGYPDLVARDGGDLFLFRNRGDRTFSRDTLAINLPPLRGFTAADFDRDGDFDVFGISSFQSFLMVNDEGEFDIQLSRGVPPRVLAAAFSDVDADGIAELVTIPGGVYDPGPDGSWVKMGPLSTRNPFQLEDAVLLPLDLGNDGTVDWIYGLAFDDALWRIVLRRIGARLRGERPRPSKNWRFHVLRDPAPYGSWVGLRLRGCRGNADAVGAQVDVFTPRGSHASFVGAREASRFSQGNHRLHFGLAQARQIDSVRVRWRGSRVQTFDDVPVGEWSELAEECPAG